jgi:hypothetical protein
MVKILILFALVLLASIPVLPGCGGDKSNGTLCASCGEEDDGACGKAIVPDDDIRLFCGEAPLDQCNVCFAETDQDLDGNGTIGNFVCQVQLVCVRPKESAARRCYPAKADGAAHQSFTCGGVEPDV